MFRWIPENDTFFGNTDEEAEAIAMTLCSSEDSSRDRIPVNAGMIAAAQAFIDQKFQRAVTLGEIAQAAGVNPSYLSRTFKSITGISIVDTLNARRMEKAKELLRAGQLKIYEVAQSNGIEDTTYFSHLFRRFTGGSPKAYQDVSNGR